MMPLPEDVRRLSPPPPPSLQLPLPPMLASNTDRPTLLPPMLALETSRPALASDASWPVLPPPPDDARRQSPPFHEGSPSAPLPSTMLASSTIRAPPPPKLPSTSSTSDHAATESDANVMPLAAVVRLREKPLPSGGGAPGSEARVMAVEAPPPLLLPSPPLVPVQRRESAPPPPLLATPATVERLEPARSCGHPSTMSAAAAAAAAVDASRSAPLAEPWDRSRDNSTCCRSLLDTESAAESTVRLSEGR